MSGISAHDLVLLQLKSDHEALDTDYLAHKANVSNPHAVTAAQAGAPTLAALAATDVNVSANAAALAAHIADTNNPHAVELDDVSDSSMSFARVEGASLAASTAWQNVFRDADSKAISLGTMDVGERGYLFVTMEIEVLQLLSGVTNDVFVKFKSTGSNLKINNAAEVELDFPISGHDTGSTESRSITGTFILRVHNSNAGAATTEKVEIDLKFRNSGNVIPLTTKAYYYMTYLTGQQFL